MTPRRGETLSMGYFHAAVPPACPQRGAKTAPRDLGTLSFPLSARGGQAAPHHPPHASRAGARRATPTSSHQLCRRAAGTAVARSCNPRGNPKRPFLFFFFFPLRALVFTCSRGCQGEARLSLSHPSGQESGTQLWKQPQRLSRLRTCPCQRAVAEAAPLPHACWK